MRSTGYGESIEEGNLGNNSPFSKNLRRDAGEVLPVKEEQPRSSSSSSDAHEGPHLCSRNYEGVDDRREEEEDECGRSAGSDLQMLQVMSKNGPALSLRVQDPQAQKADPTSDEKGGICPATTPVTVEFQAVQHGHSEHLCPEDGTFNSQNTITSSTLGGIPELSSRNFPNDQSVQAFANVRDPVSMYAVQQPDNLPETHSPLELRLESNLPQTHGSQTQIADGFLSREQLAGWFYLQQQFAMHDPTILSRSQDFQLQGYIHCDAVVPGNDTYASGAPPFVHFPSNVSQQVVGAYNMPPSVPMSVNAVPVSATFANTVLPNLEASHLDDGGDPFGPVQMNTGYIDLFQPHRSQQLAAGPISPVQVPQNRTLVLNSIYDPMYEALGLPVDPHLRLFLASHRDSGQFHRPQHTTGS